MSTVELSLRELLSLSSDADWASLRIRCEDGVERRLRPDYEKELRHYQKHGCGIEPGWLHMSELRGYFLTLNLSKLPLLRVVNTPTDGVKKFHLLLDQSGSMCDINSSVFSAARELLNDLDPDTRVTSSSFNSEVHIGISGTRETAMAALDAFIASGTTRLYDAILAALRVDDNVPAISHTLVVLTDGMDTSSVAGADEVRATLSKWQARPEHKLIFLGANQDAVLAAQKLGVPAARAMSLEGRDANIRSAFRAVSENHRMARDGFTTGQRGAALRRSNTDSIAS